MPIIKLTSAFFLDAESTEIPEGQSYYERRAVVCHVGDFESMNGPVSVTEAMLQKVADVHNSRWERIKALFKGEVPLKECAPMQVDHSNSALVTVGRLVGKVEVLDHMLADGSTVKALFGTLRVLGRENIEKARDGRWIHLSIGCDFVAGFIREVTVTPFPAAGGSALLSQPQEEPMKNRAKLKAYLTGYKKMSEDDSEAQLKKCEADPKEHEKLTAESDDHDEKEKKRKDDELAAADAARITKLTAAKGNVTALTDKFTASLKAARLAAAKGGIFTRLSKLRAEAKITPAEIKKMDIDALASADPTVVEAALKSYADREPVIMIGQMGTIKALSLAAIGMKKADEKTKDDLEADMRKNMTSLGKKTDDGKTSDVVKLQHVKIEDDQTPTAEYLQKEYDEICKLMESDKEQAKKRLKTYLAKVSALTGIGDHADSGSADAQAQITALAQSVEAMQTSFNELHQLTLTLAN